MVSEAYEFAEAGNRERALEMVLEHVNQEAHAPELYRSVLEQLLAWHDPTAGLAFG